MRWYKRRQEQERERVEAERALKSSVDHLHGTVSRGREVHRIAEQLRRIQQDNHFAEAIRHVYEGGRP